MYIHLEHIGSVFVYAHHDRFVVSAHGCARDVVLPLVAAPLRVRSYARQLPPHAQPVLDPHIPASADRWSDASTHDALAPRVSANWK
jgi:hypothetical protein